VDEAVGGLAQTIQASAAETPLSEIASSPGMLLAQVGQAALRRLRSALTADGLSPRQFQVLRLLEERGPTGQRELGQTLDADPSILVTLLNPLEHEGLLCRERDPHDRRRHRVRITEAGTRRLLRAAEVVRDAEEQMLAELDGPQRQQLRHLLSSVRVCLAELNRGVAPNSA
jgi:DNA-binding MarR family transcriptional regulator